MKVNGSPYRYNRMQTILLLFILNMIIEFLISRGQGINIQLSLLFFLVLMFKLVDLCMAPCKGHNKLEPLQVPFPLVAVHVSGRLAQTSLGTVRELPHLISINPFKLKKNIYVLGVHWVYPGAKFYFTCSDCW